MFNSVLNYSCLVLIGVVIMLFVMPLQANPFQIPDGDYDGDYIKNYEDICPFDPWVNDYHEAELTKHGVEVINYDELISFFHEAIDWDAEFHRHEHWLDNFSGQVSNVANFAAMARHKAEQIAVNIVGWYGTKKPAHSYALARIKKPSDLHRFVDQNEKFAEKLMGIARVMSLELDLRPKTPEAEKPKKPGLGRMASPVLLISSLIYEAASNRYAAAGESSKKAYKVLTSKKYRDREHHDDPVE